jgi:hypothetical protein
LVHADHVDYLVNYSVDRDDEFTGVLAVNQLTMVNHTFLWLSKRMVNRLKMDVCPHIFLETENFTSPRMSRKCLKCTKGSKMP